VATLVLTALGTAIGGPVGGAIGAMLGQQLDRAIIGNGPRREGPRLQELELQTSSYGSAIPAIFGAMRVAGTVIWASDLIERRTVNGGSKTRPATTTYSYSANLAVAVSSRPIARIGRIWADGNLLRGADGTLKVEAVLRIYNGWDDQAVDPLLASSEGMALSPAHRGLAYAVFEDLQLADFGNRIPSLTFEVFERDSPVTVGEIMHHASGGLIEGISNETVDGFALQGSDQRASITPLANSFPITLRPNGRRLKVEDWFSVAGNAAPGETVLAIDGRSIERPAKKRAARTKSTAAFAVRHYEPARDYQIGLQRCGGTSDAGRDTQIDLPVSLSAPKAKRLCTLLSIQEASAATQSAGTLALAPDMPILGAIVQSTQKLTEIEYLKGAIRINTSGWVSQSILPDLPSDAGRDVAAPDLAIGQTLLHLVDLPAIAAPFPLQPRIGIISAGTGEGWRKAALSLRDGSSLIGIGRTAPPGVIGALIVPFADGQAQRIDRKSRPIIRVANPALNFPPGNGDPLWPSAPVVHIAGEFVKYGNCQQVSATDYQLFNLVRGCFGTESKITAHGAGTGIALIDAEQLAVFENLGLEFGSPVSIEAVGAGDAEPVIASIASVGLAMQPLSPVHLRVWRDDALNLKFEWKRRSRLDTGWRDYGDLPIDEPQLQFLVSMEVTGIFSNEYHVDGEQLEIAASMVSGWQIPAGTLLHCTVRQVGAGAISPPCIGQFVL
jgi:hypothetical protein